MIKIWDTNDGKLKATLYGHSDTVLYLLQFFIYLLKMLKNTMQIISN